MTDITYIHDFDSFLAAMKAAGGEQKTYPELKQARAKMIDLMTAKNNIERILGMSEQDRNRDRQREKGR